eukprot:COSAG02_NODE_29862_length_561_cov_1.216450_1_plen_107_part_01
MQTCVRSDGCGGTAIEMQLVPRLRLLTANADMTAAPSEESVTQKPSAETTSLRAGSELSLGVSFAGLQRIVELFFPQSVSSAIKYTTDDLCQHFIRPATLPTGWMQV